MDIKKEIAEHTSAVEQVIEAYLPENNGLQKTVLEAMNYSVLAGGKRLRPMLMQETYRMFGGKSNVIEPFMAAIEFIHTYSLVHDDLPAMDNDEYRRGKKTTHAVYGEAMEFLRGMRCLIMRLRRQQGHLNLNRRMSILEKRFACLPQKPEFTAWSADR